MILHKHLIVSARVNLPPRNFEFRGMELWFRGLISALGMELLNGPHIEYVTDDGNRGLTAVMIIKTSHIAMHVWDEQKPAKMELDVYSCAAVDPAVVFSALQQFDPVSVEWKFLDRESGLKLIGESRQMEGRINDADPQSR